MQTSPKPRYTSYFALNNDMGSPSSATHPQQRESTRPIVFTPRDCESQVTLLAATYCPQLISLWASMGIDDNQCTFLLYELFCHVQDAFTTTVKEAEEMRGELTASIEEQMHSIPHLVKELDDSTAMNEMACIDSNSGLFPRAHAINKIFTRLTEEKALSTKVINDRLKELNTLYREVGTEQSVMLVERDTHDVSLKKIQRITAEVERIQKLRVQHISQVNSLAKQALTLCEEMDIIPDAFTSQVSKPDLVLSDVRDPRDPTSSMSSFTYTSLLANVKIRLNKLEQRKNEYQADSTRVMEHIERLWVRLEIPASHQQVFLSSMSKQPLSAKTIRAYKKELENLNSMKSERMGILIDRVRGDIAELWQKLGFTQQEQLLFRPFYATPNIPDDDFLTAHENERDRLKELCLSYKPILALMDKRAEYRHALVEHELNAADPDRLVSRRPNFLALKEEERIRNMEKKWLPKAETQLLERLEAWENERGFHFMFHGERVIDRIQQDAAEAKAAAAAKKRALEEARGKGTDRASVYSRKAEGARDVAPMSAGKMGSRNGPTATPSRNGYAFGSNNTVRRGQLHPTPSSANSFLNTTTSSVNSSSAVRRTPLFESRIPTTTSHYAVHESPFKPISRTNPNPSPRRSPGGIGNKENSSL